MMDDSRTLIASRRDDDGIDAIEGRSENLSTEGKSSVGGTAVPVPSTLNTRQLVIRLQSSRLGSTCE